MAVDIMNDKADNRFRYKGGVGGWVRLTWRSRKMR